MLWVDMNAAQMDVCGISAAQCEYYQNGKQSKEMARKKRIWEAVNWISVEYFDHFLFVRSVGQVGCGHWAVRNAFECGYANTRVA